MHSLTYLVIRVPSYQEVWGYDSASPVAAVEASPAKAARRRRMRPSLRSFLRPAAAAY